MVDHPADGARTQAKTALARLDERLRRVEAECLDDVRKNMRHIARLEARLESVEKACNIQAAAAVKEATVWNSSNGKILIIAGAVVLLAVVGWSVSDIAAILNFITPTPEVISE